MPYGSRPRTDVLSVEYNHLEILSTNAYCVFKRALDSDDTTGGSESGGLVHSPSLNTNENQNEALGPKDYDIHPAMYAVP